MLVAVWACFYLYLRYLRRNDIVHVEKDVRKHQDASGKSSFTVVFELPIQEFPVRHESLPSGEASFAGRGLISSMLHILRSTDRKCRIL